MIKWQCDSMPKKTFYIGLDIWTRSYSSKSVEADISQTCDFDEIGLFSNSNQNYRDVFAELCQLKDLGWPCIDMRDPNANWPTSWYVFISHCRHLVWFWDQAVWHEQFSMYTTNVWMGCNAFQNFWFSFGKILISYLRLYLFTEQNRKIRSGMFTYERIFILLLFDSTDNTFSIVF